MAKSLDRKLDALRADRDSDEFIICYAADSDVGAGLKNYVGQDVSFAAFVESLAIIVAAGDLDILLASTSVMDTLARDRRLFANSPVTPAIRANDTTDVWGARGSSYAKQPSRPFRSVTIDEALYGTLTPEPGQEPDVDLGLYSITFNNDVEADWFTLERFKEFRIAAARKGLRYFIEVYNPNAAHNLAPEMVPDFVNDSIAAALASVPRASRPEFLKVVYNGPRALEELVTYSSLIVGVLGGPPSTAYDAFYLLADAKKHGARAAFFGRRIKTADDPIIFIRSLNLVASGALSPEEAVKHYHSELRKAGVTPQRTIEEDMVLVTPVLKN